MKRIIMAVLGVAGALLAACTQTQQTLQTADLAGTYDLALAGNLLFITSTDRNELRVLDLTDDPTTRQYVRAPNPIEPLSIPVVPRPQALARDIRYDENGAEQTGTYVYARSNGSTEISVVSTDRGILRELKRLKTDTLVPASPGVAASKGPVTAFAARGSSADGGPSTLYYATQETTGAQLWRLQVPATADLLAGAEVSQPEQLEDLPGVAVRSILVMPAATQLALATRGTGGTAGKSFVLDLESKATRDLEFGAQVLQLVTHGKVDYTETVKTSPDDPNPTQEPHTLAAGAWIFGVLDPASCGGQTQCSGVLAVDASTGKVLKDDSGRDANGNIVRLYDMLPIRSGAGLPMGLTLANNASLLPQGTELRDATMPLFGIVPLSDGEILFFDAVGLRVLDVAGAASSVVSYVDAAGSTSTDTTRTSAVTVEVNDGYTRTVTYQLLYQGVLPGMDFLSRDAATTTFLVPAKPLGDAVGQVVQAGDIIILEPESTSLPACSTDVTVGSVQTTADASMLALVPAGALPVECASYTRFQVRSGGSKPLILSSNESSYLGRLGPGDKYSVNGPYFFHPDGWDGAPEKQAVGITVGRLDFGPARGDHYIVSTLSNYSPYSIYVDTTIAELTPFRLPGPVVQKTLGDTSYAYIVYPSADGVLQVNLQAIVANTANSTGLLPYR